MTFYAQGNKHLAYMYLPVYAITHVRKNCLR